jgi:hypothetical protein
MKAKRFEPILRRLDQNSTLVAVFELSLKSWLVAGVVRGLSRQRLPPHS